MENSKKTPFVLRAKTEGTPRKLRDYSACTLIENRANSEPTPGNSEQISRSHGGGC